MQVTLHRHDEQEEIEFSQLRADADTGESLVATASADGKTVQLLLEVEQVEEHSSPIVQAIGLLWPVEAEQTLAVHGSGASASTSSHEHQSVMSHCEHGV